MKRFFCVLCVLCGLNLFGANWPAPPAGYAYETDLRPHALVMTNATAAGLATRADVDAATKLAAYYPEGNVTDFTQITTEGLVYSLNDDGSATVTGYSGRATDIVIPWETEIDGVNRKVSAVGDHALEGSTITSLIAPTTVTRIGGYAFAVCPSLARVSFPSVTTIGEMAFNYDYFLTSVSLPSATTIGGGAFSSCSDLTQVSLPSAITIGDSAFMVCPSLTQVSLPSATTIGDNAFADCTALARVSLPSVASIGVGVFAGCPSLTSISLPSATSIGDAAFAGCTALSSVDFGPTPRDTVTALAFGVYSGVPTTCKIIVPLGMYDEWIATDGWKDLYAQGYNFVGYADAAKIVPAPAVTNIAREVVKDTIPQTITNVVRNVQGLVYDEKLGITWRQTMYDGNLYYVAVTNANITEVSE